MPQIFQVESLESVSSKSHFDSAANTVSTAYASQISQNIALRHVGGSRICQCFSGMLSFRAAICSSPRAILSSSSCFSIVSFDFILT